MSDADTILANAEALQQQFEETLSSSGITLDELREMAERIRRKLPAAEARRVDAAIRALMPDERRRPGASELALPKGIRG